MIIRRRHTANFTTIGNVLFEDERLAADEVGILAYLLSRPHDWEVRRPALMRRWNMGRDAIKRVISSLVRYGWCQPEKTRLANGTFHFIYEIRDEPGATLTDEEVRRALSLVSGEAASDEFEASVTRSEDVPGDPEPPTRNPLWIGGHPSLVDPSPGNPSVANISIQNNDLPRTDSTQKVEREHERAKEKHALHLSEFKRRWPTNAADDQTRVDNAWFALTMDEGEAAIAGITPFLENQKRLKKTHPPAGFNYLGQKRWTLLEQAASTSSAVLAYAPDSVEAKAIIVLHEIAGKLDFLRQVHRRGEGIIHYPKAMTPQLAALAQAAAATDWVTLSHQQAGAWEGMLREFVVVQMRHRLREGSRAPWPWPPSVDGKIYSADTGPPETLMSEQDLQEDFK
jgi:predicted transcriptional regulator